MSLINCEINLLPTSSTNCVVSAVTGAILFRITDTKIDASVVTLSTPQSLNLLQRL